MEQDKNILNADEIIERENILKAIEKISSEEYIKNTSYIEQKIEIERILKLILKTNINMFYIHKFNVAIIKRNESDILKNKEKDFKNINAIECRSTQHLNKAKKAFMPR